LRRAEARLIAKVALRATFALVFGLACLSAIHLDATGRSAVILTVDAPLEQPATEAKVSVAIVNRSHASMYVFAREICWITSLIVTDAQGTVQQPNRSGDPPRTCPLEVVTVVFFPEIKPGESYSRYRADQSDSKLTDWGYHLVPGRYTVQAVLENFSTANVDAARSHGRAVQWRSYPTIKSNIITMSLN